MDTTDGTAPLRWTLTRNAPLQALNTFHVQASAAQLLELHDPTLLPDVLALPEVGNGPLLVLGSGSNVLIAEDLPGTVLVFGNRDISFLEHRADHAVIRAGAGVPWHGLVMWSLQEGLSGLENLALIPGTADRRIHPGRRSLGLPRAGLGAAGQRTVRLRIPRQRVQAADGPLPDHRHRTETAAAA
ncbi:hypothetical protein G6F35_015733 [Rhizopus arrhizus]|nr:hypothetical protein G6F35_015733 [Rhizopus arrhizus]